MEIKVKTMSEWQQEGKEPEILFWVGSAGSFDERAKKITRSFVKILNEAKVDSNKKVSDWTDSEIKSIIQAISKYKVEGELRSENQLNIKRLMDIGSYRGIRHRTGLPLRGQRTKNNSRTRKGKRKTIANKKKATK